MWTVYAMWTVWRLPRLPIALWGQVAVYGDNKYDCSVKGLYPEYEQIEHQEMTYGRFINDVDIKESRKVCVIGKRVYESLFKPGEDPCGKYVRVNGIYYRVIGMCSSEAQCQYTRAGL